MRRRAPRERRHRCPEQLIPKTARPRAVDELRAALYGYSLGDFSSGLGGCRSRAGAAAGSAHPCCEYNVLVFDDRSEPDTVAELPAAAAGDRGARHMVIHHCSLNEARSGALARIDGLDVINDSGWELRTALAHLRERRALVMADYSRNCLADALFCVSRTADAVAASDTLAACWSKCAALYLADALLLAHGMRPRPAHLLADARSMPDTGSAALFSTVTECAGAERASPVLLCRMAEAAAGLSDLAEGNGHAKVIRAKAGYLAEASMYADCYFYLCHTCRGILARHPGAVAARPETARILRTALDAGADPQAAARDAAAVRSAAERVLRGGHEGQGY